MKPNQLLVDAGVIAIGNDIEAGIVCVQSDDVIGFRACGKKSDLLKLVEYLQDAIGDVQGQYYD